MIKRSNKTEETPDFDEMMNGKIGVCCYIT